MASRYQRPWAVLLGVLIATTINHALASSVGVWAATRVPAVAVEWILGLSFWGPTGDHLATRLSIVWIRRAAAALFFLFGLTVIFRALQLL